MYQSATSGISQETNCVRVLNPDVGWECVARWLHGGSLVRGRFRGFGPFCDFNFVGQGLFV